MSDMPPFSWYLCLLSINVCLHLYNIWYYKLKKSGLSVCWLINCIPKAKTRLKLFIIKDNKKHVQAIDVMEKKAKPFPITHEELRPWDIWARGDTLEKISGMTQTETHNLEVCGKVLRPLWHWNAQYKPQGGNINKTII